MERQCPQCQADLPDGPVEECPLCKTRLAPPTGTRLVRVFEADSVIQAGMVRSILEGSRIPAWIHNEYSHSMVWSGLHIGDRGRGVPVVVPDNLEEEARKCLCLQGIACQVTPGEVEELLARHVRPAIEKGPGGREDLVQTLALNKKEVVARVARAVIEERADGAPFIESLLLEACRQDEGHVLASLSDILDELGPGDLPQRLGQVPDDETRSRAAQAIARLHRHRLDAVSVLVDLLEDPAIEVRSEAIEGLFSLEGEDLGYEPDASPEERARAVDRWHSRSFPKLF